MCLENPNNVVFFHIFTVWWVHFSTNTVMRIIIFHNFLNPLTQEKKIIYELCESSKFMKIRKNCTIDPNRDRFLRKRSDLLCSCIALLYVITTISKPILCHLSFLVNHTFRKGTPYPKMAILPLPSTDIFGLCSNLWIKLSCLIHILHNIFWCYLIDQYLPSWKEEFQCCRCWLHRYKCSCNYPPPHCYQHSCKKHIVHISQIFIPPSGMESLKVVNSTQNVFIQCMS